MVIGPSAGHHRLESPYGDPFTTRRPTNNPNLKAHPAARLAPAPPAPGRSGAEHKYLQQLVKRLAEDRGWKATIEHPVLGSVGSIDVALEKGGTRLACEISVTTPTEHELGNIQKCLAAGFEDLIVLAAGRKILTRVQDLVSASLGIESAAHVRFLQPEEFIAHLDELDAAAASREATVRGYKVKVNYQRLGASEEQARRQAISQVLVRGLRRVKGKRDTTR